MYALRYVFEEAMASIWRGRSSGVLSTITIALAVLVPGGFLLVTSNLQRLGAEWSSVAELSVYLKDNPTAADRAAIEDALRLDPAVATQELVPKEEALRRFKQTFGDLSAAVDAAGENPLPASFDVRLKPVRESRDAVDGLASKLRQMPGVADVRYDRQWLGRLRTAVDVLQAVGLALGLILASAAALTVANVVRLALAARRDELDIMELVGAPALYVRGPFVMEGVLQGGLGATLALAFLLVAFVAVRARYLVPLVSTVNLASIRFLTAGTCVALVVAGMFVGSIAGYLAARSR
jgi:cell division transport system permease protein